MSKRKERQLIQTTLTDKNIDKKTPQPRKYTPRRKKENAPVLDKNQPRMSDLVSFWKKLDTEPDSKKELDRKTTTKLDSKSQTGPDRGDSTGQTVADIKTVRTLDKARPRLGKTNTLVANIRQKLEVPENLTRPGTQTGAGKRKLTEDMVLDSYDRQENKSPRISSGRRVSVSSRRGSVTDTGSLYLNCRTNFTCFSGSEQGGQVGEEQGGPVQVKGGLGKQGKSEAASQGVCVSSLWQCQQLGGYNFGKMTADTGGQLPGRVPSDSQPGYL